MGVKYLGRVRGVGMGPTPGRSSSSLSRASTSASHDPGLVSHEVSQFQAQVLT
jgi:hypothetical protein